MSRADSYFARLKNTLEDVVAHLTAKGIESHRLAFGGEGEKRKTRVPTDANSEFLANRAMGDWAEQVLAKAIDSALSEGKAVPYGNSDRMAAGEEGFREFYLAGVEETRVHGKRPDLLLFDVKVATPSDLSCLRHTDVAEFVGKAIAAIEVRSSKFEAQTYMKVRERQRAAGKKSARESPSFTVKVEDLVIVYRWLEQNPLPQSYCQVFFDTAYAINFLDIFQIIASGVGYKIERPKKSQAKATIMIPITSGTQIGHATAIPTFAAEHRVTELGRHDAYVVPQGGGFELDAVATRKVLLAQS
jgi:hypothetical protein